MASKKKKKTIILHIVGDICYFAIANSGPIKYMDPRYQILMVAIMLAKWKKERI